MTAASWPPRRTPIQEGRNADLEALTGLRSSKPHHFRENRTSVERLERAVSALERISTALVRTMDGSEGLIRAVVAAAGEQLSADWVVFALRSGALLDAQPRHLVRGPDGAEWLDHAAVPTHVRRHIELIRRGNDAGHHDAATRLQHLHVPITLEGQKVVGGFAAWTPPDRRIDPTDTAIMRILASQAGAALQSTVLQERAVQSAVDLAAQNDRLRTAQAELVAARQRETLDGERHRIARELHDSVSQLAVSAGMFIDLVLTDVDDEVQRERLRTAKDLTGRAAEQLRSAIWALNNSDDDAEEDLPSLLRELSGVHMPSELQVDVRIGGKPVPLAAETEQSLVRIAGEALFNTAVHARATRATVRLVYSDRGIRLTIADNGEGSPEDVRRSLRAASLAPSGEHRGLVNMQTRAREIGGTLTFRRARIGGLQVQVDLPVPDLLTAPMIQTGQPTDDRKVVPS